MKTNPSVLFIGKKNDFYCKQAIEFVKAHFPQNDIILGKRNEIFPEEIKWWEGDYIISYLSPWIVPEYLLNKAKKASINFHPGPPEYPGIGCTNFAIYDNSDSYGITCHHMNSQVDTGNIISVKRFPIFAGDSVFSLTQRCYGYIIQLFYEVSSQILAGDDLSQSDECWKRKPYKRSDLQELCRITPNMSAEEIGRRVRAVTFPNAPGAYVEIEGIRFNYDLRE